MAGDQQFYLKRSYVKAFGQFDPENWKPSRGFAANEPRILKLYEYYRDTYLAKPDLFLWAGLGRMAGAAVVGGLRLFAASGGETFFSETMVDIGKKIFEDLAWQHEAILDDEANALKLAGEHDAASPAQRSYRQAWEHILSRDPARVATGNKMLLENEQFTIIQPFYNQLVGSTEGGLGGPMRSLKAFTNSIHPYHRDFLISFPHRDIVDKDDRWSWITETGGMWEKWAEKRGGSAAPIVMKPEVRKRLVERTMAQLIRREYGEIDPTLLPVGAFDSEG
jgi:hypothetical protein